MNVHDPRRVRMADGGDKQGPRLRRVELIQAGIGLGISMLVAVLVLAESIHGLGVSVPKGRIPQLIAFALALLGVNTVLTQLLFKKDIDISISSDDDGGGEQ